MPSEAFYQQTSDDCLLRNTRDYSAIEYPISQTTPLANKSMANNFNTSIDEWTEWMRWEATSAEELSYLGAESSLGSNSSEDYQWQPYLDAKFNTFEPMAINDVLYEFDDSLAVPVIGSELCTPGPLSRLEKRQSQYGYSSSNIDEVPRLQEIVSPYSKRSAVKTVIKEEERLSSSPEPEARTRVKKRRSSTKCTEVDRKDPLQSKKQGHNAIEKRYRTNLNEKIILLQQSVPSLHQLPTGEGLDDKSEAASEKRGKAVILTRAVEYITHLENCAKRLGKDSIALKARVAAFEKLAMSGSI